MANNQHTDQELVSLFQTGDNPHYAFNLLLNKHKEKAYFFIRKMVVTHEDADDVLQEVWVKIWEKLHTFRGDAKFTTWMFTICSRHCINHLKKQRKHLLQSVETVQYKLSQSLEADAFYSGDEMQLKFDQALLTLPHKQRMVFNLRYFEELSFKEIAEITGTSLGGLKANYHLAVKKLEEFIKAD